ncbi:MAG: hypothetical protein B7Z26_01060 [Asticcacaulis sp. 32-58-5]|nr:MAG: hypothetical protein B7Z26_01060 [Asticcacaulis sp. 32-58-5]
MRVKLNDGSQKAPVCAPAPGLFLEVRLFSFLQTLMGIKEALLNDAPALTRVRFARFTTNFEKAEWQKKSF